MPFAATCMELETIILSEVKSEREILTNTIWYHLYVESKIQYKGTYLRDRKRLTDTENRLVVAQGEEGWGKDGVGVWD